jgi:hypothetical protein
VLNLFWELIPLPTVKALLKQLSELAFDASSGLVRAAVLEGLAEVVDNHLSHPLLKVYLPLVSTHKPMIHTYIHTYTYIQQSLTSCFHQHM